MIYSSCTACEISQLTGRHCIRFTEMAFVVVAVFSEGRPSFISKAKLRKQAYRADISSRGIPMEREWKISTAPKAKQVSAEKLEVWAKRARRVGLTSVRIEGDRVWGIIPRDEFETTVARQSAKEMGFTFVASSREVYLEVA